VADPLNKQDMADRYGYALSFLKADPELWSLFNKAVKENHTEGQFAAEFQNTDFFRKHAATYRKALELKTVDPATWNQTVDKQRAAVADIAGQMGVDLSSGAVNKMANDIIMMGWSEAELQNKMAGLITTMKDTGHYGGQAGETEDKLNTLAGDYAQRVSAPTMKSWIRAIARGDATENDFKATMEKQAQNQYAPYVDQIKKGLSVRDIASPYIETMARTLELDPANIDMFDKSIQKAMTNRDANSGKPTEYSLSDFETDMRKDPRWAKTSAARDAMSSVANEVLKNFGFRG
jgi:hypothetical protein